MMWIPIALSVRQFIDLLSWYFDVRWPLHLSWFHSKVIADDFFYLSSVEWFIRRED